MVEEYVRGFNIHRIEIAILLESNHSYSLSMQISLTEQADRLIEKMLALGYKDPIAVVERALERMVESELSVSNIKTELLFNYYEQRQNQLKDYKNLRLETFQRIGRNIVNFQKIEAALKVLSVLINIQAHPGAYEKYVEEKLKLTEKQTLGTIAPKVLNRLYGLHADGDEIKSEDLEGESISISYCILMGSDELIRRREHLSKLIKERNMLVHKELSEFDFSSSEGCYCLIKTLDEQNIRILQQLDEFKWVFESFGEAITILGSFFNSDEFSKINSMDPNTSD